MRSGLVFAFAVAGCNSIFGSHDVSLNPHLDADLTPKDAAPYTMYVTGMTYDTTQQPIGMPDSGTAAFPILAGTTVKYGMLGATPQPLGIDNTGAFSIPYDVAQGVYRVIYTPPDGVPVEIQGKLQSAHFVVPSIGRPDAMPAPSNAILGDITPAGGPNQYNNLHVFSIGTFAVRLAGVIQRIGSSTTWSTSSQQVDAIQSMSGALFAPESAKNDRLIAVDTDATDQANGFSIGTIPDFSAGYVVPTMTAWKTVTDVGNQQMKWGYAASQMDTSDRLMAATSPTWTNDNPLSGMYVPPFVYGGVLPTTKLPNFVEPGEGYIKVGSTPTNRWAARGHGGLGMPIFLPLTSTTSSGMLTMIHAFNGSDAPAFPTAMYLRYSRSGVVEGVTLTAGIQTIAPADLTTTTNVPVSVGLAYTATQHISLNGLDIWTDNGNANSIMNAPAEMDLVFDVDKPATTDDCVSTIYEIDSGALVPVHRFISTPNNVQVNATIQVDKSIFAAGQDYVIGISCHQGLPMVATALDWSHVTYPFSESVTWSHPFNVQ
jgi:hypothetical protein